MVKDYKWYPDLQTWLFGELNEPGEPARAADQESRVVGLGDGRLVEIEDHPHDVHYPEAPPPPPPEGETDVRGLLSASRERAHSGGPHTYLVHTCPSCSGTLNWAGRTEDKPATLGCGGCGHVLRLDGQPADDQEDATVPAAEPAEQPGRTERSTPLASVRDRGEHPGLQ